MFGPHSSSDEKKANLFASFPAPQTEEADLLGHERQISPPLLKNRTWLLRLAQLFRDLIGEPANTNLPDLNQENP